MMKRIVILAAVAIFSASMLGCQCRNLFRRGSQFSTPVAGATCYDPCQQTNQCNTCQGAVSTEYGGTGAPVLPGFGSQ